MSETSNLSQIEMRCNEILHSPYLFKELPSELQRLRTLLAQVEKLTREDVPFLIAEVKRLRAQNKRLEVDAEALDTFHVHAGVDA
jgi:ABC-type phosphate transport system auxiliary subunit